MTGVQSTHAKITVNTDRVDIVLAKKAAAIVATPEELTLLVDDSQVSGGKTLPHIAKLNLAMMFIHELERFPDWFARGVALIHSLKEERENGKSS